MQHIRLAYIVHTFQFHCDKYFYMSILNYSDTEYRLNIGVRFSIQSNLYITTLNYSTPRRYDDFFVNQTF